MSSATSQLRHSRFLLAALATAISLAACSSDKIVYRDRQPFNTPPVAAAGFVGYYDTTTKQTTCGNCHADYQADWSTTKHAHAVATLTASAGKADACYSCHTVTGNGNAAKGSTAGHDAVKVAAYNDVQCESCHGAGLQHVEGVGQGTLIRPLAAISMTGTGNCGDCHSGVHNPFAEEWKASEHAVAPTGSHATSATCAGCHEGRAALAKWGVKANYKEKTLAADPGQALTCAVCHDPHGSANPAQLRKSISSADPEQNLCMQCHNRRNVPETGASSPHAPQGAVLLGLAGYRPPGFAYDTARIYGSHATNLNPRLCAGCHVTKFTVTDKLTGAFTFQATGHLMRPVPCLDATGKPTADKTCAYTTTARSWQSCTASGCHATAAVAANAFNTVRARMKFLADQIWLNSNNDGTLQGTPTDGGILATLKSTRPSEWSNSDNVITPAEGAEFNARLCGEYNQANSDNSKGIHNPFLCEALLVSTINYLRSYYSLPAASISVQEQIDKPMTEQFKGSMHVSRSAPR
ncbi:MAG TPA: cytochrome c3 family protein [Gemmatimonadaceae bacterium]|jgi:predicted CXXCH cytochrome family protein|nr:cytochrome c3 family protein [Gemmatimonadaceae bacterium]